MAYSHTLVTLESPKKKAKEKSVVRKKLLPFLAYIACFGISCELVLFQDFVCRLFTYLLIHPEMGIIGEDDFLMKIKVICELLQSPFTNNRSVHKVINRRKKTDSVN